MEKFLIIKENNNNNKVTYKWKLFTKLEKVY